MVTNFSHCTLIRLLYRTDHYRHDPRYSRTLHAIDITIHLPIEMPFSGIHFQYAIPSTYCSEFKDCWTLCKSVILQLCPDTRTLILVHRSSIATQSKLQIHVLHAASSSVSWLLADSLIYGTTLTLECLLLHVQFRFILRLFSQLNTNHVFRVVFALAI